MNKIWLTGDAVVDLIPDGDNKYLKCPGGAPANVAVAISRLGGNTAFVGRVGLDPFGHFLKEVLASEGVNVDYLTLDSQQRTSTVVVDLSDDGERSFTFMVKKSADQYFNSEDIPHFSEFDWLHTCSIAYANQPSRSTTLECIEKIQQAGGFVSFDPNLREDVWADTDVMKTVVLDVISKADVIKLSSEELTFLTDVYSLEEAVKSLNLNEKQLVIVTLGDKGALYQINGQQHLVPTRPVAVVDTTGAGDAFVGGMLYQLSQVNDWRNLVTINLAIKTGNMAGGLATTQKGAMTALPKKDALYEVLNAEHC